MNKLNHHLRQYRHNNDDGLIMGYEQEGTEAFVSCLELEISELKVINERYRKSVCSMCDGHGAVGNILDSMDCPDCTLYVGPTEEIAKQQTEINELKAALQLWVYMVDSGCSDHSDINEHNAEATRKLLNAK